MPKELKLKVSKEMPKKSDHILGILPSIFKKKNGKDNHSAKVKVRRFNVEVFH